MLTKFWTYTTGTHWNLFETCIISFCNTQGWKGVGNQLFVPRIMMLVGALFVVLGAVVGLFELCCDKRRRCLLSDGMLTMFGGLVILAACAVYTALNFADFVTFGYSFYLGWVSGAIYILTGALLGCAGK
ncbi:claudin domain-containing protein 2-like [Ciona intestinalis]